MDRMQHLTPERLAALADGPASLVERAHIADCAQCAAELAAAQRLVRLALTDVPAIEAPLTSWERLGPALRDEGLLRTPEAMRTAVDRGATVLTLPARRGPWRALSRAAAALALVAGGAALGRFTMTPAGDVAPAAAAPVALASEGATPAFQNTGEAMQVLQRASDDYTRAVTYLATHDSSVVLRGRDAVQLYQARLDALDRAVAATQAALYLAPQDPVLNQYYLTTLGARDLTLQQMGAVVPVAASNRTRF
jgi:hypothetical protein